MKYKLNEYHRNVTEEELLNDLKRVSIELNKEFISRNEYIKHGKYSFEPFRRVFKTWKNSLKNAGLRISSHIIDYSQITNDDLINDIISISKKNKTNTVTTAEYKKFGKFSIKVILKRFNKWDNFLKKANLKSTGYKRNTTDNELLLEIERIWVLLGRQPTSTDINKGISKYSLPTFSNRFGSWRKALEKFIEFINGDDSIINLNNEEKYTIKDNLENNKIKRKTNRNINLRLRFIVFQRDNFKCKICGKSPANDPNITLHVDHIIPWSKGGETNLNNLQTLCSNCNLGKGNLL